MKKYVYWALLFIFLMGQVFTPGSAVALDSELRFQIMDSTYFGQEIGDERLQRYSNFIGNMRLFSQDDREEMVLDAGGVYSLTQDLDNHVTVPEVYYSRVLRDTNWEIIVGRKLQDWSLTDRLWSLEFWEPQFKWDSLRPEAQGIMGLSFHHQENNWNFLALVSPYFIPSQGPQFKIQDGQIHSLNPWFDSPADRLHFGEADKDIDYEVIWPNPLDVIQQTTIAMYNRVGGTRGPWGSLSLASKPINKVHIAADAKGDISTTATSDVRVDIYPLYVRQQLATIEAGWHQSGVNAWISYTADRPEEPDVPSTWIQSNLGPTDTLSLSAESDFYWEGFRIRPVVSYLRIWEKPFNADQASDVQKAAQSLSRFDFNDAIMSKLQTDWMWGYRRRTQVSVYHIYSFAEKGSIVGLDLEMAIADAWGIRFQADVLGSDSDQSTGFISRYSANDRVQGSLIYVF